MSELAYRIDLEYPKTICWNKMSDDEREGIVSMDKIFSKKPKPVIWGKFLNRWVSAWACQAVLPCGWVYRCTLRNGKTFDYLVPTLGFSVEDGK
jgi:hypothetical protein